MAPPTKPMTPEEAAKFLRNNGFVPHNQQFTGAGDGESLWVMPKETDKQNSIPKRDKNGNEIKDQFVPNPNKGQVIEWSKPASAATLLADLAGSRSPYPSPYTEEGDPDKFTSYAGFPGYSFSGGNVYKQRADGPPTELTTEELTQFQAMVAAASRPDRAPAQEPAGQYIKGSDGKVWYAGPRGGPLTEVGDIGAEPTNLNTFTGGNGNLYTFNPATGVPTDTGVRVAFSPEEVRSQQMSDAADNRRFQGTESALTRAFTGAESEADRAGDYNAARANEQFQQYQAGEQQKFEGRESEISRAVQAGQFAYQAVEREADRAAQAERDRLTAAKTFTELSASPDLTGWNRFVEAGGGNVGNSFLRGADSLTDLGQLGAATALRVGTKPYVPTSGYVNRYADDNLQNQFLTRAGYTAPAYTSVRSPFREPTPFAERTIPPAAPGAPGTQPVATRSSAPPSARPSAPPGPLGGVIPPSSPTGGDFTGQLGRGVTPATPALGNFRGYSGGDISAGYGGGFDQAPTFWSNLFSPVDSTSSLVPRIPSWYSNATTAEDYAGLAGEQANYEGDTSLEKVNNPDRGDFITPRGVVRQGSEQQGGGLLSDIADIGRSLPDLPPMLSYAYGTYPMPPMPPPAPRYGFGTSIKKAAKGVRDAAEGVGDYARSAVRGALDYNIYGENLEDVATANRLGITPAEAAVLRERSIPRYAFGTGIYATGSRFSPPGPATGTFMVGDSTDEFDPAAGGAKPELVNLNDPEGNATADVLPLTEPGIGNNGDSSVGALLMAISKFMIANEETKSEEPMPRFGMMGRAYGTLGMPPFPRYANGTPPIQLPTPEQQAVIDSGRWGKQSDAELAAMYPGVNTGPTFNPGPGGLGPGELLNFAQLHANDPGFAAPGGLLEQINGFLKIWEEQSRMAGIRSREGAAVAPPAFVGGGGIPSAGISPIGAAAPAVDMSAGYGGGGPSMGFDARGDESIGYGAMGPQTPVSNFPQFDEGSGYGDLGPTPLDIDASYDIAQRKRLDRADWREGGPGASGAESLGALTKGALELGAAAALIPVGGVAAIPAVGAGGAFLPAAGGAVSEIGAIAPTLASRGAQFYRTRAAREAAELAARQALNRARVEGGRIGRSVRGLPKTPAELKAASDERLRALGYGVTRRAHGTGTFMGFPRYAIGTLPGLQITAEDQPYVNRVMAMRRATPYSVNPFAADYALQSPTQRAVGQSGYQTATGVPKEELDYIARRYSPVGLSRQSTYASDLNMGL